MKNDYKIALEEVKEVIEKYPDLNHRKMRFKIIELLTGVTEKEARISDRYGRAIREIIAPDTVGITEAEKWKMPEYMRPLEENKEWNEMFKRNNSLA